jgi:hypothetical protein
MTAAAAGGQSIYIIFAQLQRFMILDSFTPIVMVRLQPCDGPNMSDMIVLSHICRESHCTCLKNWSGI